MPDKAITAAGPGAGQAIGDRDRFEEMFHLVGARQWVGLAACGLIVAALLAWACLGRLHYEADGMGLIRRAGGTVDTVSSPAAGTLQVLHASLGQEVRRGDVLARIELLAEAAEVHAARASLRLAEAELARARIAAENETALLEAGSRAQVEAQKRRMETARAQAAQLKSWLLTQEDERRRGLSTRPQVMSTQAELFRAEQSEIDAAGQLAQLQGQLLTGLDQRRETVRSAERAAQEARGRLELARAEMEAKSVLQAPAAGRVAALPTVPGAQVVAGQAVAVVERGGGPLEVIAYLPLAKGRSVEPGMQALVSPTYIERGIYGSIIGEVAEVSPTPADAAQLRSELGDSDLGRSFGKAGPVLQARIRLLRLPNGGGLRWTSGRAPDGLTVMDGATAAVSVLTRTVRPVELVVPISSTWVATLQGRRD